MHDSVENGSPLADAAVPAVGPVVTRAAAAPAADAENTPPPPAADAAAANAKRITLRSTTLGKRIRDNCFFPNIPNNDWLFLTEQYCHMFVLCVNCRNRLKATKNCMTRIEPTAYDAESYKVSFVICSSCRFMNKLKAQISREVQFKKPPSYTASYPKKNASTSTSAAADQFGEDSPTSPPAAAAATAADSRSSSPKPLPPPVYSFSD